MVSTSYNYVGVGLALGTNGKKLWTAVYMRGPDLTGAKAKAATPTIAAGATSESKRVTVTWSGGDVPLQVLTSGFHSYQVQRRVDGGDWKIVWIGTTRKSMTLDLATNHRTNSGSQPATTPATGAPGRSPRLRSPHRQARSSSAADALSRRPRAARPTAHAKLTPTAA